MPKPRKINAKLRIKGFKREAYTRKTCYYDVRTPKALSKAILVALQKSDYLIVEKLAEGV